MHTLLMDATLHDILNLFLIFALTTYIFYFLGRIVVSVFTGIFQSIANNLNIDVDSTDKNGKNRSGLVILTDYQTKVQYVRNSKGGMCVRVDSSGNPITSQDQ